MIEQNKVIVMDIDGSLCDVKREDQEYIDIKPKEDVINKLIEYRNEGFYIILYTSRNMRTHEGNLGKINAETSKVIFEWLDKHNVPYDEIYFGKPWAGRKGFYVDDKAVRPKEFLELNYEQIIELLM
jgi:capsule biosynthesis phosphatase